MIDTNLLRGLKREVTEYYSAVAEGSTQRKPSLVSQVRSLDDCLDSNEFVAWTGEIVHPTYRGDNFLVGKVVETHEVNEDNRVVVVETDNGIDGVESFENHLIAGVRFRYGTNHGLVVNRSAMRKYHEMTDMFWLIYRTPEEVQTVLRASEEDVDLGKMLEVKTALPILAVIKQENPKLSKGNERQAKKEFFELAADQEIAYIVRKAKSFGSQPPSVSENDAYYNSIVQDFIEHPTYFALRDLYCAQPNSNTVTKAKQEVRTDLLQLGVTRAFIRTQSLETIREKFLELPKR